MSGQELEDAGVIAEVHAPDVVPCGPKTEEGGGEEEVGGPAAEVDTDDWWTDTWACQLRWEMAGARGLEDEATAAAREWYRRHPHELEHHRRLERYFEAAGKAELAEENAATARALEAAKAELEDSEE